MTKDDTLNRRDFISKAAVLGVSGGVVTEDGLAFFSSSNSRFDNIALPVLNDTRSLPQKTYWIIPHTHWEGAVFKTREQYLDIGLPNILIALKLLNEYPEYRFTLDQVCYIKPFLERYPEAAVSFRQFVSDGRLEIVGGTDTMFDANIPSGESMVRQMLYGKKYFREALGVEVAVGWALDTFGTNAQMPQMLKLAGYKSYWIGRGVANTDVPTEWMWEGIDGTRIPTFLNFGGFFRTPEKIDEFTPFIKKYFDKLAHWAPRADRKGLVFSDVTPPLEGLPAMAKEFEKLKDKPFSLRLAVPSEFEAAMQKYTDLPVMKGELNPVFQGAYSSRIELKQMLRNVERLLTTAEKLDVLCNWLGKSARDEKLWSAWEPSLFNQAHDLMAGVMTDHVYEDTIRGYDFSTRLGNEMMESSLDYLATQVDTRGQGIPLVVFNSVGWMRDDVVETVVGFKTDGIEDIQVIDPGNRVLPVEIIEAERFPEGGLKTAKIIFIARGVPALGYAVYRVAGLKSVSELNRGHEVSDDILENDYYRMKLDLSTGAITSLELKENNWEVLDKKGNVIVHQYDGGDLWELYENLRPGQVVNDRKQPVPQEHIDQFSTEYPGDRGKVHVGPVYSEYNLSPHRFCAEGILSMTVRIFQGLRRIDISTKLLNNEKFVRYQVLFPTTIANGRIVHEIPFGSLERSNGMELPAQNWADYSDREKGLALLNRGLPGNLVSDSTMMLSLMRSARIASYVFDGGYERGMSSDTGLMLDKELVFNYALVPHTGDWRQGEVYRHGMEYNNPLLCCKAGNHAGKLPKTWGLLEISKANVLITALKQSSDGFTVLRLYEASGTATPGVSVRSSVQIDAVYEANLIEDTGDALSVERNIVRFDLRPFEIKTLKIRLRTLVHDQ